MQIETIEQFEQVFKINLGDTNIQGFSIMRRDCLEQIDIDQAMFKLGYRNGIDYEYDGNNLTLKKDSHE